ncbi:geobacillin-26 family protein [Priestia koreensis]|uniref:geobacillin-26 family protein n=1 Tax=Priestia koreensis TaxID=284581 RepID=UPI002041161C|nr:geobacillin-26 family protein [Priestia koreensis]MCM3005829.1 geobacillin-26 family protein [Priestia koreensis]
MKKVKVFLLSLLAVLLLVITPLSQVHAEGESTVGEEITFKDGITATTLEDNDEVKKVETKDDENRYIATYYKQTGDITYETYDENNKLVSEDFVGKNLNSKNAKAFKKNAITTNASSTLIRENTLKEVYGYWIYKYNNQYIWVTMIRKGVAKNPTEKDANRDELKDFKSSVDSFMSNKDQLVAKVGAGIIATIVTLYLVPEPTWTKILAGLLTIISSAFAYAEGKAMYNAYMDSRYYFARITI